MSEGRRRLYGRHKGRPLSAHRSELLSALAPLDLAAPRPTDLAGLFPRPVREVRLEIGFGGGERLVAEAAANRDVGFIGIEPFINGLAKAAAAVDAAGLDTARLHGGDATPVLDWLPDRSLARIDLLYPDPWPKRRHWKRRFVSQENLDRFARLLVPGGIFRFASDIPHYVDWTLQHGLARSDFTWTAERADDWRLPWPDWPGTRYEAKAIAAGRRPAYLTFRRS